VEAYDPSKHGFTNARLLYVACKLNKLVSKTTSELAYGADNPLFLSASASREALQFFSALTREIDWYADQAAEAMTAASADTHPKDGDVQQAPLVSGTVPEGQTPNV
jgi:hypothetical protein